VNIPRLGVRNPVPVNLLMWAIVIGGGLAWGTLTRELLPSFEPEQAIITVAYPGATPEEVENSVVLPIEREIEGVEGVEEISAEVLEGVAAVRIEMEQGADRDQVINDLRNEMDRVRPDLPDGAEEPEITALRPFFPVISVMVHGDVPEERLRDVAEDVRRDLVDLPEISEVTLSGVRDREIWAEILPERLEEEGLTFEEVGRAVAAGNLDLPGGQLESARGNVRVRTMGESKRASQIETLVVRALPDGGTVRLGDVAVVRDTFEDKVEYGRYLGRRAANVTVFKTPEQDAIEIADIVKDYVAENPERLGGSIELATYSDLSRFVVQRLDLMLRNAKAGFLLVCICLALFLDLRVAFWTAVGLPVAFLGTFIVMFVMGQTVNLISLFGLIIVLGLIVDDAIVIGENVFTKIREGMPPARAAVRGAAEVTLPVLAAVTTTVVAFAPLQFLEGRFGAFLGQLPKVAIAALSVSLIEALLILPAHLGHQKVRSGPPRFPRLTALMRTLEDSRALVMERILPDFLERVLRFTLRWRYVAVSSLVAFLLLVAGLIQSGIVPFVLFQELDAENVTIDLEMAAGTPVTRTEGTIAALEEKIRAQPEVATVYSVVGSSFSERGRESAADPATVGQIQIELRASDERQAEGLRTSKQVLNALRADTQGMPGVVKLTYRERSGGPGGAEVEIRIRGEDLAMLEAASAHVRETLGTYSGVFQIEDDLRRGKLEARLRLRDGARSLGLTTRELALQTRHALFGFEAQDLQEADGEITVRVVLPEAARQELSDLGRLRIATPSGARVPLEEVAELTTDRGYAALARVAGKRAVTVTASVDDAVANVRDVTGDLEIQLADIGTRFPGVSVTFQGRQKETAEAFSSLPFGFTAALLMIYALLAAVFRSYMQPMLVMTAIPFALAGAVVGHAIMGYPLGLLSMIGSVALTGIVVNDSLILVDFVNRHRREHGQRTIDAVVRGARARMRAILLTSVTTIAGLAPIMYETSFQAQFLIPMAVAITFGLAFATVTTLLILPTFYVIAEDGRASLRWVFTGRWKRELPEGAAPQV
jgi:multidrug efflux pump subunit AcrB